MVLKKLNIPQYKFRIKRTLSQKYLIFDVIRKKYLPLTKEEWVRQNYLKYLIHQKKYPIYSIVIEKEIKVFDTQKRIDIMLYDNKGVKIIIECKSYDIEINQNTLEQIMVYNMQINAQYLVITNGMEHFNFVRSLNGYAPTDSIPNFG